MNKGMYSYVKPNTNIKTKYIIEYTRDQKVFDLMDTAKFTFDMLDKKEYDYIQDAINAYNVLYYDETILHVMLFEQIILNDETILEQCKDMQSINILDQHTQNTLNKKDYEIQALKEELQKVKIALQKHNMTIEQLTCVK